MIRNGDLQEEHMELIMLQFDRQILESFRDMAPHRPIKVYGQQTLYNFVEECHKFKTKQFELKGEDGLQDRADVCKIFSVNARSNTVEPPPMDAPKRGTQKKKGGRRGLHN